LDYSRNDRVHPQTSFTSRKVIVSFGVPDFSRQEEKKPTETYLIQVNTIPLALCVSLDWQGVQKTGAAVGPRLSCDPMGCRVDGTFQVVAQGTSRRIPRYALCRRTKSGNEVGTKRQTASVADATEAVLTREK
jgi:hypothetical protein